MRHWKVILAIIAFLGEGANQVSGYTSLPLAVVLIVLIVVLLIWSVWPILKRIRLQKSFKILTLKSLENFQQELSIEIDKAFSSAGKGIRIDGETGLVDFIVNVELTLKPTKPNMSLSWMKLCIGGEERKPFESNPPLRDTINPTGESYELKFKVPRYTFLKGRYSTATAITPDSDEPKAQIYVKAGGDGRRSREFTIQHQELDPQT